MKKLIASTTTVLMMPAIALAQFEMPTPSAEIFGRAGDNKVLRIMEFVSWAVQGGAAVFAVMCLVLSGNYMNRGEYAKALGAFVGAAVSGLAPFVVKALQ